jgi:glyoxalase family protein
MPSERAASASSADEEDPVSAIQGFHHVTACVEGAQEDIDFYTGVLGASLVKQTVLLDGKDAVYHLYYADDRASVGTVLTSFPYKQRGIRGRRGTGQVKRFCLSVPSSSLEFWQEHLSRRGVEHGRIEERFGRPALTLEHPAGLEFELVGDDQDTRRPWTTPDIPEDHAVRGLRSVTLSLRDTTDSEPFMAELGFRLTAREGPYARFEMGDGGVGRTVDFLHEPDVPAGTWTYAAGTAHHVAFAVRGEAEQLGLKERLEGLGYIDFSEIKNRSYFRSVYFRMPGGVLFELATTTPGFTIDEPADRLGRQLMLPDWFEGRREEILAGLEPISVPAFAGAS